MDQASLITHSSILGSNCGVLTFITYCRRLLLFTFTLNFLLFQVHRFCYIVNHFLFFSSLLKGLCAILLLFFSVYANSPFISPQMSLHRLSGFFRFLSRSLKWQVFAWSRLLMPFCYVFWMRTHKRWKCKPQRWLAFTGCTSPLKCRYRCKNGKLSGKSHSCT